MSRFTRFAFKFLDLLVIFMMTFGSAMPASAKVWTDPTDYPPGSTVAIQGDNSDGAAYIEGETVHVEVTGPNDENGVPYASSCDAVVTAPDTANQPGYLYWTCSVTLWDSPYAEGLYNYTAYGSQVTEQGTFTDAAGSISKVYQHWADGDAATGSTPEWNNNILSANKSDYFEGEVIPHVYVYTASNQTPLTKGQSYSFNVTYNYYQQNTNAGGFAYMTTFNLSRQPGPLNATNPYITPTADSTFTNGGGMQSGASFYTVDADITAVGNVTYTGAPGNQDGHVTITFTYTGTTTTSGIAEIYFGLFIANPGQVPDQGAGKTKGASAWSGGSLQTTVDIGGSGATSIQLNPAAIIAGQISGMKFNDLNGNGTKDTGEPGLAGWTIQLCADSACNTILQTAVTDASGAYSFSVTPDADKTTLVNDPYYVREINQGSWTQTAPSSVFFGPLTVSATTPQYLNQNFGNFQNISLSGYKWNDLDGHGVWDVGEPGLQNWTIQLDKNNDGTVDATTITDATGKYTFTNLGPGTYKVSEVNQSGWTQTFGNTGYVFTAASGQNLAGGSGVAETYNFGNHVTFVPNPHLSITKSADITGYNAVGQVITYTIVATNDGNTNLASVTVTDPSISGITCTPANGSPLAVGASMTCTGTHTVTQADLDAGHYANTACVDDGTGGAAQACASKDIPGTQTPHLSITKSASPASYSKVGDVINYTIVATNDGNVTLNSVTVTDPSVSGLTCTPANGSPLAPGASMNCTATHTVVQADLEAGHYANTACVDDGAGGAAQACASKDVPGNQNPHLTITKDASPASYSKVGDVITYTIVATNDGNVTLKNVTVTDPSVTGLTCSPANGSDLAPGASLNCTATHTVTQADLDAGHYANTACVDDGTGGAAQACASKDVPGTQTPHLSITKTADPASFNAVGQVITYTIVATNDGNTTLQNVTISDPSLSGLTCTPANGSALVPGASITCTGKYTISQADLDAGYHANTACVDDGPGGATGVCTSKNIPGNQNPALSLTKSADPTTYDKVGDVITYTLVATNTGNVTLTNVSISDPLLGTLTCNPAQPATLAPNGTLTCTGTHMVTQADLDAGHYANTACVDDGTGGAQEACASKDVPGNQNPHLRITKSADPSSYSIVGEVITYTIVATNDGNVTLHSVTVTDPSVTGLTCTPDNGSDLTPGASLNCTATHTVTQADLDAGHYANTACVDDGAGGAAEACASKDVPGTQNPHLSVTKSADPTSYSKVGDIITYTIVATNDGNVTLHNVLVTDPSVTGLTCTPGNPVTDLAPGGTINCTATHTVVQADLDAGHYFNQACVDDGAGGAAQACASQDVPGTQNPALAITKVATETGFSAVGDVIHYTIVATNTGNITLHNVNITDPNVTNLSCTPALPVVNLAPGASINCTASHTIIQADLDSGSFYNQACVDDGAGGAAGKCAEVTTPGTQTPHLAITKNASPATYSKVGDVITYTIVATNDGNVTLHNVTVTDPSVTGLTCTPANGSDLAPSASMNCTATHTVTQADLDAGHYANTACVDDGTGGAAQACASKDVPGAQTPAIDLVKNGAWNDGNGNGFADVGETISYTFTVKNIGNVTLHNVTIADKVGGVTVSGGPIASLAPGASDSTTFTGSYTLTQADIDAGSFYNVATTCGLSPKNVQVCDDGDRTVTLPPRLIVKKIVINDNGDTKIATDFSFKVNSGSAIAFLQDGSDQLKGKNIVTVTGSYTVTEPAVYGYTTTYSADCTGTIAAGQTKTCTITNNDQPGTIIIKKISDPVNTGSFAFTTSGTGYNGFTLPGGGQNSQQLNAGTYTVKESSQLGWTLTGIGGSTDPNTPYACTVSGSGGSTGSGDPLTAIAAINLKNGDTVTCVFENTSNGATRTQGFWATHPQLAKLAWEGGTALGHTFPGVAAVVGDTSLCGKTLTINEVMGGFWSDISKTSTGVKRSSLNQSRMQLLQQLLAAELNASAFGSAPSGGAATINSWEAAFCGSNQTAIKNAQQASASFNSKGDSSTFTPGTSADSKNARLIANIKFWDIYGK